MVKKEPLIMGAQPRDPDESKPLRIRRGRVESVDLYEIKDSELEVLEKGSPADLQLNFSIFLLSTAFSGVCSLATATFGSKKIETAFIILSVVGILFGSYLMIAWWRNRTSLRKVAAQIRQRIPPETSDLPSAEDKIDNDDSEA